MAQPAQGGLGAMAPARPPVPQPAQQSGQAPNPAQAAQRISGLEQEAPAEEDFMERALRNKRAQEAALNSQIEALKNSLDSRMSPPFDTSLMAAAAGFLKPTKTGGFGESAGYAAEAYAAETDKDLARKQAVDKAKLELAQKQAAMQSQNLMFEHQMQMAGYDPKELTTLVTGPAGGSPLGGAPAAGGAPTEGAPAAKRAPREARQITERDIQMAYAISPEYGKQVMDQAKFQQDDLISTPQGPISKRTRQAVDVGLDVPIKAPLPFVGPQEVTQRILNDIKALEAKYPQGNPNRADAFAQYYASKGIGGVDYAPGTAGTPPIISGMESPSKKKLVEEGSSQTQKLDIEENAKAKLGIYDAGRGAYSQILAADQLYRLSTDPKTRNAFGVLQQNNIQSAIMGAIADGIQTPTGSIKFAGIEDAVRKIGGTQAEVNAALQAARYYAELELNYARTYLKGQGAVSDNERKIVGKIGGSLSDTAQVAAAKAETVKARANYDKKVSDLYYQWEKNNPGKMVKDFERDPRYTELQGQFDEHMGKLADKYFPGTPSKPSASPSTAPSANPPASPAAPRPQTKPPENAPAAPPVVSGDDDPAYKNLKPGQQYIYNGQVKTKK